MTTKTPESGADELRAIVRILDGMRESFNDRYTLAQLVKLVRIARLSEWTFTPDQWSHEQLHNALTFGIVPAWNSGEVPLTRKHALARMAERGIEKVRS